MYVFVAALGCLVFPLCTRVHLFSVDLGCKGMNLFGNLQIFFQKLLLLFSYCFFGGGLRAFGLFCAGSGVFVCLAVGVCRDFSQGEAL